MYKYSKPTTTLLNVNDSYTAESIEQKVRRVMSNKEPITDGAPQIYTPREAGVMPAYNIRTDRFEIAVEAHDKIYKTEIARRAARHKGPEKETEKGKDGGGKTETRESQTPTTTEGKP